MELTNKQIREVLSMARSLAQEGEYDKSLFCYEYFFAHSLDDDPYALYGVRLSYCLDEWAILGKKYPLALEHLEKKKKEVLALFEETLTPLLFHEFCCISKSLDKEEDILEKFLEYHHVKPEAATKVVYLVWDDLIEKELWSICACYPNYINQIYDKALHILDSYIQMSVKEPIIYDDTFKGEAKKTFIETITNLLLVLQYNNKSEKIDAVKKRIKDDMPDRNFTEIETAVFTKR